MDLKQLKTFLMLSKIRNYTKTASELGYAQSSISAQIQQLEQELDTQLFDRIGKNIYLTAAGELMVPYASEMIALASEMKERIDCDSSAHGRITIGASESLCVFLLPQIVKSFMETHPKIELQIKLMDQEQAILDLYDNTIDLALTIGNPITSPNIKALLKKREEFLVLASPNHPMANMRNVVNIDFSGQPFILTGPGCNYRSAFEHELRTNGIPYQIVLETGSIQAIKEMTASGLGLSVLPRLAVREELIEQRLVALPYENNIKVYTQLYCHSSKWLSSSLSALIREVKCSIEG